MSNTHIGFTYYGIVDLGRVTVTNTCNIAYKQHLKEVIGGGSDNV